MKSLLLLSFVVALATGCSRPGATASAAAQPPVPVQLATVQAEVLSQLTDVSGTVRPVQHAVLAAKLMGAISDLPVALGQPVREGDVLLNIYSADLAARLAQARAQLNVVSRDLERERDLLEKGASTTEMVRNLQDRYTGCEASVRDAEVQLGYTAIRAPFNGVIARKLVQAGDLAAPGQPLLEIEGTAGFEVEACIPESLASALTPGAPLECGVEGRVFTGTLREISSTADVATRSIGVKIDVPAGVAVRSGQFTRIHVPGPGLRTLVVPASAVSVNGQMERSFVVGADNRAVLRIVKTGAVRGDRIVVLSGVTEGERLVVAPPATLRDGAPLEVRP